MKELRRKKLSSSRYTAEMVIILRTRNYCLLLILEKNLRAISFPLQIRTFIDNREILVICCKMHWKQSNSLQKLILHSIWIHFYHSIAVSVVGIGCKSFWSVWRRWRGKTSRKSSYPRVETGGNLAFLKKCSSKAICDFDG